MKKNLLRIAVLMCLCIGMLLSGCAKEASNTDLGVVELPYYDQTGEEGYNTDLFYRNDLPIAGADPQAIYVTEGEYEGWFFLYNSDETNFNSIYCMKSRDLYSWEMVGDCFTPELESWGRSAVWAPEVIYDESDDLYYLYYCARNTNAEEYVDQVKYIGLAVSDSPAGPFVQYTGTNGDGRKIELNDPIFDPELLGEDHPLYKKGTGHIDASPFIDPETGDKYLYIARNRDAHDTNTTVAVKMKDWATPDYSTYTVLTTVNRTTYNGDVPMEKTEGEINEAPQMLYHEGTYYLTYSINMATDKDYAVVQALADDPLGPFTKVQESQGGLVLGVDLIWDHCSSTGSHSFVYAGDELFIVYHANVNREFAGDNNRRLATDRVAWAKNDDGQTVLKTIGPTWSVQPKPDIYTGYTNLAKKAKISATNVVEGSSASYLNDGVVRLHEIDCPKEFYGEKKVTITMDYDEYITARSLLIYNSYEYNDTFYQIETIDFSFRKMVDGKMCTGVARIEDVYYDFETYAMVDYEMMRPAAPMVFEFDEIEVNKVTITLTCPEGQDAVSISEIMLMGKELE